MADARVRCAHSTSVATLLVATRPSDHGSLEGGTRMSAPETPSDSDPRAQAAPEQNQRAASGSQPSDVSPSTQPPTSDGPRRPPRKRPWGWIAIAGLLAACVVGLGIYAVNLNSDVDDANAQIAAQQEQIDAQQDRSTRPRSPAPRPSRPRRRPMTS